MRYRVQKISPTVPTASMADIAFLLIIFFMLTTSFSPERTNVSLPDSQIQAEVTEDAAIVAITADGQIMVTSGEEPSVPMDLRGLSEMAIEPVKITNGNKEFLIKADSAASYRYIDEVLDTLRKAEVRYIALLTRRKVVDPETTS